MSFWYLQFSKKTNEKIQIYYYGTSSWIVFVCFLGELKTPKRHFQINRPLGKLHPLTYFSFIIYLIPVICLCNFVWRNIEQNEYLIQTLNCCISVWLTKSLCVGGLMNVILNFKQFVPRLKRIILMVCIPFMLSVLQLILYSCHIPRLVQHEMSHIFIIFFRNVSPLSRL